MHMIRHHDPGMQAVVRGYAFMDGRNHRLRDSGCAHVRFAGAFLVQEPVHVCESPASGQMIRKDSVPWKTVLQPESDK